jgi:hypothetical protein
MTSMTEIFNLIKKLHNFVKTLLGFIIFKIKTHKTKKYFIKIK